MGWDCMKGLAIAGWDFVEMILLSFKLSFFGSCDVWSFGSVECDGGKVGYDWLSAGQTEKEQRLRFAINTGVEFVTGTAIFSAVEALSDQGCDAEYCCLEYR